MKLGNTTAGAFIGWVSCALLAGACGDEEGVLPTASNALMPAGTSAAGAGASPDPGQSSGPPPAPPAPAPAPPSSPSVTSSECPLDREVLEQASSATYALVFRALTAANEIRPIFTATAFAVGPNLLATNSHVTRGLEELMAQTPYQDVVAVQAGTGTVVPLALAVTHPDFTGNPLAEPDVGLLTTTATLPSVLELAPTDGITSVGVTDDLYVVGFPGDVDEFVPTIPGQTIPQATALPGDVTALRNFDPNVPVTPSTTDIIQHDAATSPGMSGSPMLHCGAVIGVNNAGTIKQVLTPDANGELLLDRLSVASNNFGIDIKHLHELMSAFQQGGLPTFDLSSHPPVVSPPPAVADAGSDLCNDTCIYAADAECDDGGANALPAVFCDFGTDCTDCGPRSPTDVPPTAAPPTDAAPGPATAPVVSDWALFTDQATGEVCDTVNGADFEAIVLLPSRELMLVNVVDPLGQQSPVDVVVSGLTVDENGNVLSDGALTGGVVSFAADGDGNNRLWAFLADGTLLSSATELAGLTPDGLTGVRCDACGAVDQPPPQLCP